MIVRYLIKFIFRKSWRIFMSFQLGSNKTNKYAINHKSQFKLWLINFNCIEKFSEIILAKNIFVSKLEISSLSFLDIMQRIFDFVRLTWLGAWVGPCWVSFPLFLALTLKSFSFKSLKPPEKRNLLDWNKIFLSQTLWENFWRMRK